jgi:uncharacterized protein YjgD (DUF1641 family)
MFFKYLSLLEIKEISTICSKPYGFELMVLIYNQTKNNADIGIEETYDKLMFNKSQRPAFINFINELEHKGIVSRHISSTKKSKVLLRLSVSLMNKINQILEINR